jgi:aminotransferase
LRKGLSKSFKILERHLSKLGFFIPEIEGGFFIWARLPEEWDVGFKFAMDLYNEEKVAVIPGEHFSDSKKNYIRFNVARSIEEMEDAVMRLDRFFAKHSKGNSVR